MENLNAETLKKDLKELMFEAYASNGAHKLYLTMRDALALITSQEQRIRKLTEENERLRAIIEVTKAYCDKLEQIVPIAFANEKADIVREMQERITEHATNGYPRKVRLDVIDQIAKEMLEGENEN